MKRFTTIILSLSLLGGCVSQQSQQALAALQAQCAAGDHDACTAAGFQTQANLQEQQNNAAVAAGVGAALLGGAVAGAAIANQPNYVVVPHGYYAAPYGYNGWHH
jgi:hypothetical protein